jgi:hypothetical protein
MSELDLYEAGLEAAIGDYEDRISPYCQGYQPAFITGYNKGWELVNRVLQAKAANADRLPD